MRLLNVCMCCTHWCTVTFINLFKISFANVHFEGMHKEMERYLKHAAAVGNAKDWKEGHVFNEL